jgi:uncharacterized protein YraI
MPRMLKRQFLIAFLLIFPLPLAAQVAVATRAVNLRAGPDRSFPLVAWFPAGTTVRVMGCINGYQWCDVISGPNRGWIYAGFLSYTYHNQPVIIYAGGPSLGFPIVTFSVGAYWGSYYSGRPWYSNRYKWSHWNPPPPRPYPHPRPPSGTRPPPRPTPYPTKPPPKPITKPTPRPEPRPTPQPKPQPSKPGTKPAPRPQPQPKPKPQPSKPGTKPAPKPDKNPGGTPR